MKKYIYLLVTMMAVLIWSCQDEDQKFGPIVAPSNLVLNYEIVGADAANPYGDGSGWVNFTASADNAISYSYTFGDNSGSFAAPSGANDHRFSQTGVNEYTVTVVANGTGGVTTSTSIVIEVFSSFSDEEAERFLSGTNVGDSKTWYWQADKPLHVGLGPFEDDYGNGEFAYEAWWNSIQPWDTEKSCMYGNQFVFTKTANGVTFEQTVGPAFIPGAYAGEIGVTGEQCHDETVVPTMFGVKNVTFAPSSTKAALEGSYNNEPYRQTSFEISDGGFMGWYVGSSTYDIISVTEDELFVRVLQAGSPYSDGGYAWYSRYSTRNPFDASDDCSGETGNTGTGDFQTLVWSDEFDEDGAPCNDNWAYDLGNGQNGWGNQEDQYYTDRPENVVVENGILKITAKAESFNSFNYTSARIKTQDKFDFTYGRVVVRAKLPTGGGTWPAIWMLGSNFPTVGWPDCGEIDIMEHVGNNQNVIHGTLHYPGNSGGNGVGGTTNISNVSTEFKDYEIEWDANNIVFKVDGTQYFTFNNDSSIPFNHDFFLILNVAMGGTFGGAIDASFTESTMEIDYVRVYQ